MGWSKKNGIWQIHREPMCLAAFDADPGNYVRNGSTVSQWTDISGHGNHIIQSIASNQPTWIESSSNFGGRGSILFAALQGLFASAFALASPFTVVTAIRTPGSSLSANRTWMGSTSGPLTGINYVNTVDRLFMYSPAPIQVQGPIRSDASVVVSSKWLNGAPTMRTSASLSTIYPGSMTAELSFPGICVGCASDLSRSLLGEIQSLYIFSGALSDADEQRAIKHLADKCKIQVTP